MTTEEKAVMADMYYFLRDALAEMPMPETEEGDAYWDRTLNTLLYLVSVKHGDHPLIREIGLAMYNYLSLRASEKKGA